MLTMLAAMALTPDAHAFCGTYVGEPGATITNNTSQLLIARQGTRTTLTMANDFAGDPSDFAMVIPVPQILSEDDVRTVIPDMIEEAERYSGPRLVEYTCEDFYYYAPRGGRGFGCTDYAMNDAAGWADTATMAEDDGSVEVEAEFEAGEYSIVILSAEESGDLLRWLDQNGYGVTTEAADLLQEYIDSGSYFLAAQVHYEMMPPDTSVLSPLQIGYDSPMFSLPIRLGTLNSPGAQELVVYVINDLEDGQAHIANYPEATLTDECMSEIADFPTYYAGRLDSALPTAPETEAHWLLEYSWSPYHCDPCPDDAALAEWVVEESGFEGTSQEATFTRLRMRYAPEQVTGDLLFNLSGIPDQVQQRYIQYNENMEDRFPICNEAANTAELLEGQVESCDDEFAEWDKENRRADRAENRECGSVEPRAPALAAALLWLLGMSLRRRRSR
ncbi:MAG: DUF2330 domain-containing protein [Alphaproteobacteria bacterium]|nr:DUF2330 domain-containing protein [Alphaproteobacteria bacterium]